MKNEYVHVLPQLLQVLSLSSLILHIQPQNLDQRHHGTFSVVYEKVINK